MDKKYAKAYTEVIEILKHIPKEEYDKIPETEIQFYENNCDKNYKRTTNITRSKCSNNFDIYELFCK